jgi:sec-independent protein translocase protein TatA
MGLDNPLHIAFLLIVLLLVFGARRLPEMGRSLGSGLRGFRDALGGEPAAPALQPARAVAARAPAGHGADSPAAPGAPEASD